MAIEAWFDYDVYMFNKLTQMKATDPSGNWTMDKLVQTFADAGFLGAEGAQQHFLQYGANEDVAPNRFFNATEYYEAKAAQYYGKSPSDVTDLEVANMKVAIHDAGMNAWTHYQMYGTSEGVNPSNAFDTSAYMEAKLAAMQAAEPDKGWTMDMLNDAFQAAGLSALEHFALYGGKGAGEVAETYDGVTIPTAYLVPEDQKVKPVVTGETYTLTGESDIITGTIGNDLFDAPLGNDGKETLSDGDMLDGGAGVDTLNAVLNNGGVTPPAPILSNIENVILRSIKDASAVDLSKSSGIQSVTVQNSNGTATVLGLAAVDNLIIKNQAANVSYNGSTAEALNLTLAAVGTADTATVVDLGTATVAKATTLNATLNNANATIDSTIADKFTTVTIAATGTNTLTLADSASTITDLTITGSGSVDLSGAALTGALTTIDASANTGGVNLKVTPTAIPAEGATITGGSGNDELTFTAAPTAKVTTDLGAGDDTLVIEGALGTLAVGSTFNGGDGADTLILSGITSAGVTAANGKMFSGFETLVLQGTSSYEMGLIAGISNYVVGDASGATAATFTNVSSGTSILVAAHDATQDTVSATLANGATAPALSLVLDNQSDTAATGADVTVETNAYTLNLTSGGNLEELALNKVTLSGDSLNNVAKISVTGDSDFSLTTNATKLLDYIDASAVAADVTVDASDATTVAAMTITTGSGQDTITAADAFKSTIEAGKGADIINLGTTPANNQGDVLILKAGDSNINGFDLVNNFAAATSVSANADKIDISSFGINVDAQTISTTSAATITGTFNAAKVMGDLSISVSADNATGFFGDHGVMVQLTTGNTAAVVFIDADGNGNWNDGDQVILLGGDYHTDTIAADNFIF